VLLRDTVRLMAEEAEWQSRKNARKGLPPVKPAFDDKDVEETLKRFRYIQYDDIANITPDIRARFRDAGHIIGASIVETWVGENATKIVFSGDIGPQQTVIERPPTIVEDADYVVIESTYGDRAHKSLEATRAEFRQVMQEALSARGKILIPTFVVDRAQRILYELLLLQRDRTFPKLPQIFFDSPMGARTTEIYDKYMGLLSRELQDLARGGQNPFAPEGLSYTDSVAASRAINEIDHAIVLAGSGMCAGGRIVHHLKHNLWSRDSHVIFVGYQAQGTLGRRLVEGEKNVRIAGEDIVVGAHLHTLGGFSAHGDRNDLLDWAGNFKPGTSFFVTHGEPRASEALAEALRADGYPATAPKAGMTYDLVPEKAPVAVAYPTVQTRETDDREAILALLRNISEEAESLREDIDRRKDYAVLQQLLESSRLILQSARNIH